MVLSLSLRMERNVQGLEDLDERFDSAIKLLVGMGSHEREADQRIARSDSWSHNGIDEDTFLEEHSRHAEGLLIITDKEWDDRRRGVTDLEAQLAEAIQAVSRLLAERCYTLGLTKHDLQSLRGSSRRGWRTAGAEDIGASVVAEIVDEYLATSDEATERGEALTEGTHEEVDLIGQTEVVTRTATVVTEYAEAVSFVDHHRGVVLLRQTHDLGEIAQVTLHTEDTVDDDELDAVGVALLEATLESFHIIVLVAEALSGREADTLDDRSVIECIPDDIVFTAKEAGDDPEVDLEARGEDDGIFLADEGSQLLFQLEVRIEGPVEEAAPCTSRTILLRSGDSSSLDLGMVRQSEVRVRPEHEDLTAIDDDLGILVAFYLSEVGINPCSLSLLGLGKGC